MEINRIYPNTAKINRDLQSDKTVNQAAQSAPSRVPSSKERRRRPDRRKRQLAFSGPDRRKRKDRRQPKLLHARTGRPDRLDDLRGSFVDASV